MISNFFYRCLSELIPPKMSKGKRHLPMITLAIKRQMRKRDRLFKKARRRPNTAARESLGVLETKSLKIVHKAHCDYINNIIGTSLSDNPKTFRSYIKCCLSEHIGIPFLRITSKLCATGKAKAEALNDYFQSVFTQENTPPNPSNDRSPYTH